MSGKQDEARAREYTVKRFKAVGRKSRAWESAIVGEIAVLVAIRPRRGHPRVGASCRGHPC